MNSVSSSSSGNISSIPTGPATPQPGSAGTPGTPPTGSESFSSEKKMSIQSDGTISYQEPLVATDEDDENDEDDTSTATTSTPKSIDGEKLTKSTAKAKEAAGATEATATYVSEEETKKTSKIENLKLESSVKSEASSLATSLESVYNQNQSAVLELPLPANAYEVLADSETLATEVRGDSLDAMVAANDYMTSIQSDAYAQQIDDINKYIDDLKKVDNSGKKAKVLGNALGGTMIALGVIVTIVTLGAGAAAGASLIIGGTTSIIMASDEGQKLSAGLTNALVNAGLSQQAAMAFSVIIITGAQIALSMGGSAAAVAATKAVTTAATTASAAVQTAKTTAQVGTQAGTTGAQAGTAGTQAGTQATLTTTQQVNIYVNAFSGSLRDSAAASAKATATSISNTSLSSISNSIKTSAIATKDSVVATGSAIKTAVSSAAQSLTMETMKATLLQIAANAAQFTIMSADDIAAMGSNLASKSLTTAAKYAELVSTIIVSSMGIALAEASYEAAKMQAASLLSQSDMMQSTAWATEITSLINLQMADMEAMMSSISEGVAATGATASAREIGMAVA